MTWRTPPSLKWLIVKHSRLQGELVLLECQATALDIQVAEQKQRIEDARQNLLAIERALTLHEIQVEPDEIARVVPHANKQLYEHGDLTRKIYAALRITEGWMSTADVVEHATGFRYGICDSKFYEGLRRTFRRRLRALAARGCVERQLHPGRTAKKPNQSLWRLPPSGG
jgi:hypothetical protein